MDTPDSSIRYCAAVVSAAGEVEHTGESCAIRATQKMDGDDARRTPAGYGAQRVSVHRVRWQ